MGEEKDREEIVEEEMPPLRLWLFFIAGVFTFLILAGITLEILGILKLGAMSLIAGFRIIIALFYPLCFIPSAVLLELLLAAWKKRPFRPLNIILTSAYIAEFVILMVIIASIFEMVFPNLDLVDQAPVLGVSFAIAFIVSGATSRIPRVRSLLKKASE